MINITKGNRFGGCLDFCLCGVLIRGEGDFGVWSFNWERGKIWARGARMRCVMVQGTWALGGYVWVQGRRKGARSLCMAQSADGVGGFEIGF